MPETLASLQSLKEGVSVEKRRGGLRAIAAEIPRIAGAALGKRGFGEAQLVTQWEAVIGAELAEKLSPERLTFPRGERRNGTLRLRVASAFATEAQHLEPVLIERINAFFGYGAIARLALIQGPPLTATPTPPRLRQLGADEQRAIDARVAGVADPELRAALARLGSAVAGSRRD
jgi:hypothetical protein